MHLYHLNFLLVHKNHDRSFFYFTSILYFFDFLILQSQIGYGLSVCELICLSSNLEQLLLKLLGRNYLLHYLFYYRNILFVPKVFFNAYRDHQNLSISFYRYQNYLKIPSLLQHLFLFDNLSIIDKNLDHFFQNNAQQVFHSQ